MNLGARQPLEVNLPVVKSSLNQNHEETGEKSVRQKRTGSQQKRPNASVSTFENWW